MPRRLPVLRSLASFHLYRGEIDKTRRHRPGDPGARRAGDDDPASQVEGHLLLGPALAFMGTGDEGLEHLDRAIALFDPDGTDARASGSGPNPGVAARGRSRGCCTGCSAIPDTAAGERPSALELAARAATTRTRWPTPRSMSALLDLWSGDLESADERARRRVSSIAEAHDYDIWKALGLVLQA